MPTNTRQPNTAVNTYRSSPQARRRHADQSPTSPAAITTAIST